VLLTGQALLDLDCLDDVARRFLETIVDTLIDDEQRACCRSLPVVAT